MVVVVAKVGFHLHPRPSPNPPTFLLLHNPKPLCHFHCRPIFIPNHRFLLLLSPWPPHHIPRSHQYLDSNAESYNTNSFNFDEGEEFDESTEQWDDVLDDYIDSIWILKVFRSYGWALPIIVLSMLFATGPKAFLMALALPLGQSTFTFAIQRFQNRGKIRPKPKPKAKTKKGRRSRVYNSRNIKLEEEKEEEVEWIRRQRSRKRKKGYQSWISKNDVSVSSGDRTESTGSFGGWDELDAGVESNVGFSRREARRSSGSRRTREEKGKRTSDGPLLLRLLISIFPFLSSWTKVL